MDVDAEARSASQLVAAMPGLRGAATDPVVSRSRHERATVRDVHGQPEARLAPVVLSTAAATSAAPGSSIMRPALSYYCREEQHWRCYGYAGRGHQAPPCDCPCPHPLRKERPLPTRELRCK